MNLFEYAESVHIPAPCAKDLPEKTQQTLDKLVEKGRIGVTWDDFASGFALRSRIADLRNKHGYLITTKNERLPGGCVRARYVLIEKPAQEQL